MIIREKMQTTKPINVIVTFLKEINAPAEEKLDITKISFKKSRKLLASCDESFSDTIIEARRNAV